MSLNELQTLFDMDNKIRFKLYSLEYIIEQIFNEVLQKLEEFRKNNAKRI